MAWYSFMFFQQSHNKTNCPNLPWNKEAHPTNKVLHKEAVLHSPAFQVDAGQIKYLRGEPTRNKDGREWCLSFAQVLLIPDYLGV